MTGATVRRQAERELLERVDATMASHRASECADPELFWLKHLPCTADVEARVDKAVADFAIGETREPTYGGGTFVAVTKVARARQELASAKRDLAFCHQRDAIRATRPAGCTCLGDGITCGSMDEGGGQFCTCPDGQRTEAARSELQAAERVDRRQRHVDRFLDALPMRLLPFTLDSFPVTTAAQRKLIATLREWAASSEPPWLFMVGPVGTGKTGLAKATAQALIENDVVSAARFTTAGDLLARIRRTFDSGSDGRTGDVLDEYREAPLLVLDDLGAERATPWAVEQLFLIINHRYDEMMPTIVTSNLSPDGLAAHLSEASGNPTQGKRVVSRIVEVAEHQVLTLEGMPNLRHRDPRLRVVGA